MATGRRDGLPAWLAEWGSRWDRYLVSGILGISRGSVDAEVLLVHGHDLVGGRMHLAAGHGAHCRALLQVLVGKAIRGDCQDGSRSLDLVHAARPGVGAV